MKLQPPDMTAGGRAALAGAEGVLLGKRARVPLRHLKTGNPLSVLPSSLAGANVLIRTQSQLNAALALIALDGIAARMVIAPPDLKDEHLQDVIARAGINMLV